MLEKHGLYGLTIVAMPQFQFTPYPFKAQYGQCLDNPEKDVAVLGQNQHLVEKVEE